MKLSNEQIGMLRNCIVQQVAAAGRVGAPRALLFQGARMAGFSLAEADELDVHLDALTVRGWLEERGQAVHAALKRWHITADGLTYAEQNGLA